MLVISKIVRIFFFFGKSSSSQCLIVELELFKRIGDVGALQKWILSIWLTRQKGKVLVKWWPRFRSNGSRDSSDKKFELKILDTQAMPQHCGELGNSSHRRCSSVLMTALNIAQTRTWIAKLKSVYSYKSLTIGNYQWVSNEKLGHANGLN